MAKTAGWQLRLAVTTLIDGFVTLVQSNIAQPLPGGAHTEGSLEWIQWCEANDPTSVRSNPSWVRCIIDMWHICGWST